MTCEATALRDGYDLNVLTKPGFYFVTDPTNGPDTGDWYVHVYVAKFSGAARQFQLAWSDAGNTGSTRSFTGTTGWTAWSNVNSGGAADLSNVNDIKFDTTPTDPVTGEGALYWDADNHTLVIRTDVTDVIQQIGQEQLIRVYNDTGATLTDGTPVYVSGTDVTEGRLEVSPAQADDIATARVIGVVTADIANGAHGYVCSMGRVNGIDTSSFSAGALLYLDAASPGGFTATKPALPNVAVEVGYVVTSDAATGAIYVNPHDPVEQEPFDLSADITASTLLGNQNNWNPTGLSTANVVRVASDADGREIRGMQTGSDGRVVAVINTGANTIVFTDEDANATAANRFDLGGVSYTLQAGAGIIFWYDSTDSRWRPLQARQPDFQNVVLETFTASGTWTKDAGLVAATVIVVGGGGAGGGAAATGAGENSTGGGGGAGGVAIESFVAADLGATETVTIGAAGAGASGTTGGNGGTSSFGSLCSATGGSGGSTSTASSGTTYSAPGDGGVGSGGDINIRGAQGGAGHANGGSNGMGGRGADSEYGGGGEIPIGTAAAGNDGQGYGSGGSGAFNSASETAKAGGNGTAGIVIVAEYY